MNAIQALHVISLSGLSTTYSIDQEPSCVLYLHGFDESFATPST